MALMESEEFRTDDESKSRNKFKHLDADDLDKYTIKDQSFELPKPGKCRLCGAEDGQRHGLIYQGITVLECPLAAGF